MNFSVVLKDPTKRHLLVYGHMEYARREMLDFFAMVKSRGAIMYQSQRLVKLPEGGTVRFAHVSDEIRGLEIDNYEVDGTVSRRMGGHPLLALLATRVR